jgi:hypothetical protein
MRLDVGGMFTIREFAETTTTPTGDVTKFMWDRIDSSSIGCFAMEGEEFEDAHRRYRQVSFKATTADCRSELK